MPGYVRYLYKDVVLPTHTKPAFKQYNIRTVKSVVAKNVLILMSKILQILQDQSPNLYRQIHQVT